MFKETKSGLAAIHAAITGERSGGITFEPGKTAAPPADAANSSATVRAGVFDCGPDPVAALSAAIDSRLAINSPMGLNSDRRHDAGTLNAAVDKLVAEKFGK